MIRPDQYFPAPQIRPEVLDKMHNRQHLSPSNAISCFPWMQNSAGVRNHFLSRGTVFLLLHL